MDISSGEEQARQEDQTLEALENPVTVVNLLVNLQDPILETPENLTTTVDTLINLQELQEPIVTSLDINPSQEKVRYISKPFASSFPYTVLISYLLSGLNYRVLSGCPPRGIPKVVGFRLGCAEIRNSKVQTTQDLDRFRPQYA
jgi:hypothetical protein